MASIKTLVSLVVPAVVAVVGFLLWKKKSKQECHKKTSPEDIISEENEEYSLSDKNEVRYEKDLPTDNVDSISNSDLLCAETDKISESPQTFIKCESVKDDYYVEEQIVMEQTNCTMLAASCDLFSNDSVLPVSSCMANDNHITKANFSDNAVSDFSLVNETSKGDVHNCSWSEEVELANTTCQLTDIGCNSELNLNIDVSSESEPSLITRSDSIALESTTEETLQLTDIGCNSELNLNIDVSSESEPSLITRPDSIALESTTEETLSPRSETEANSAESISSVGSNDSGKGGSVTDVQQQERQIYQFIFPSDLCALLVGKRGRTVNGIRQESGATVTLFRNMYSKDTQICALEGFEHEIQTALELIKRRFPRRKFPEIDFRQINAPQPSPVLSPELMQMSLPEIVNSDVVVSSIVNAGQLFVQQPTHPTYHMLERLVQSMYACYTQEMSIPQLPKPIEAGVICAAPIMDGWYRAQVVSFIEETDQCDVKFLDYGGYTCIPADSLKQIRGDFMNVPFQAVECYLANVAPLEGETDFSEEAGAVLEELTQGQLLEAQVVAHDAETNVPFVNLYQVQGNVAFLLNRELVLKEVCRWMEDQA